MATSKPNKDLLTEASKHDKIDLDKLWSAKLRFTPEELLKRKEDEDIEMEPR